MSKSNKAYRDALNSAATYFGLAARKLHRACAAADGVKDTDMAIIESSITTARNLRIGLEDIAPTEFPPDAFGLPGDDPTGAAGVNTTPSGKDKKDASKPPADK